MSLRSPKRLLILLALTLVLIGVSTWVGEPFERNLEMIRNMCSVADAEAGVPTLPLAWPLRAAGEHPFAYLVQSHLLAAQRQWALSAAMCDRAWQQIGLSGNSQITNAEYVAHLCSARHLAAQKDWQAAADQVTWVWILQPSLIQWISSELSFDLGNAALTRWNSTGDWADWCRARSYFEATGSNDGRTPDADVDNRCRVERDQMLGRLEIDNRIQLTGCVGVDPYLLEYPGEVLFRLAARDCGEHDAMIGSPVISLLNRMGNGGLKLPDVGLPALGVAFYYLDVKSHLEQPVIKLDAESGRRYLAIAPRRGTALDLWSIGSFSVQAGHHYLIGGIARSPGARRVALGCLWIGGNAHDTSSLTPIDASTWALGAILVQAPATERCAFVVYNDSQDVVADVDSLFFAEVDEGVVRQLLAAAR